jgi:UDP-glucose 4-epimerase
LYKTIGSTRSYICGQNSRSGIGSRSAYYYLNNTVKTHTLLQAAVRGNVKHFVFSSTAAVYGNPSFTPVSETADPAPLSPYGRSKLMSEYMLVDAGAAYNLRYVTLRYFNVAGADPAGRLGQSALVRRI